MFWRERKKWIYFVKIGAWDTFRIGFRSIERILIVLNEEEKGKKSYISFSLGNNAKIKWKLNKLIAFKWFKTNKKHIINCALILNVKISRKNFFFFWKNHNIIERVDEALPLPVWIFRVYTHGLQCVINLWTLKHFISNLTGRLVVLLIGRILWTCNFIDCYVFNA